MGRGALPEVWDGLGDPPGDLGWVDRSSERSGTGQVVLPVVRDG